MFFGMSYGEVFVIVGVGAVVLGADACALLTGIPSCCRMVSAATAMLPPPAGRKDLVSGASLVGRLTGRGVGFLSAARNRFASFTESAELTKVGAAAP